jgi:hypothetical protein
LVTPTLRVFERKILGEVKNEIELNLTIKGSVSHLLASARSMSVGIYL